MKIYKLLITAGFLAIVHHSELKNQVFPPLFNSSSEVTPSANGDAFVKLPPYSGLDYSTVIVITPRNCPKKSARRAEKLVRQLKEEGVPVVRRSNISFSQINTSEIAQQVNSVMMGELPIVLMDGKGKPNPTLEEVLDEYYMDTSS